jgi:deoxycytidylate deaminase
LIILKDHHIIPAVIYMFTASKNSTEMVFAIVAPLGVNRRFFVDELSANLQEYGYELIEIRLSSALEPSNQAGEEFSGKYEEIYKLMQAGNAARAKDKSFLAKAAISDVYTQRQQRAVKSGQLNIQKFVYLINSIKHTSELELLKNVYGDGFYLLALTAPFESRYKFLIKQRGIIPLLEAKNQVRRLIDLDSDDACGHGQEVTEVFHHGDYFVGDISDIATTRNSIDRFLKIVFNHPYVTPTFSEYAMHMAYVASTKSADMSRQVGAVVSFDESIVSLGANEVPQAGGGTYWPRGGADGSIVDASLGRDYTHGYEANKAEINQMISNIQLGLLKEGVNADASVLEDVLKKAGVTSLTEFGRMLHAEMDALLECTKRGIGTRGAVMYITTFPCHNCAKHIVGAGVSEVIFIEPYPKSKALQLHSDSIRTVEGKERVVNSVVFRQFVGLGPRYYMALFSLNLGKGHSKIRKGEDGVSTSQFIKQKAVPRMTLSPVGYLGHEIVIHNEFISGASESGRSLG